MDGEEDSSKDVFQFKSSFAKFSVPLCRSAKEDLHEFFLESKT